MTFDAWCFPDGEAHLQHWMRVTNRRVEGRLTYQYDKYLRARQYCAARRVAVDVGAHVGLWSFWMARDFAQLEAFEPHSGYAACWAANMAPGVQPERPRAARLHPVALGASVGTVALETGPLSSGQTYVKPGAPGDVPLVPLDAFALPVVDLLKIDCEGYEFAVLEGARATIAACRPVIVVEQKTGHGRKYGVSDRAGVDLLRTLGYRVRATLVEDVILTRAA